MGCEEPTGEQENTETYGKDVLTKTSETNMATMKMD